MSSSTLTNTLRNSGGGGGGGGGRILLRRCGLQQDYCSSQKRQLHASQAAADIFNHMQGPRMLGKMIRKQERLLKSAKQSGQQTKPKKLTFQDTSKMRSFNTTLLENLTWVLYSPKFQSIITGKGFVLTKVRVNPGFSEVYATYQTSSMGEEEAKSLDKCLGHQANNIRLETERMSLLGQLPRLVFVRDAGKDLPMPTPEELQRIVDAQREMSNIDISEVEAEVDPIRQFSHLRYLKPHTDVLRFNREKVMEKIINDIKLSRPAHRQGKHLEE